MNSKRGQSIVVSIFVVLATLTYSVSPLLKKAPQAEAGWFANDLNWKFKQKLTVTNSGAEATDTLVALRDKLVAHYTFDEGSDTTAADSSGSTGGNKDLTITGLSSGIDWVSNGKYDHGIAFDGTATNYLSGSGPSFSDGNMTLSVWAKTGSLDDIMLVSSYSPDGGGYGFYLDIVNGNVHLRTAPFGADTSTTLDITGTETGLNDNAWHLITVTADADNQKTRLYIDGSPENISQLSGSCGNVASYDTLTGCSGLYTLGDWKVGLGDRGTSDHEPFIGAIDELRAYDVSLTSSNIDYLYNNNVSPTLGSSVYANSKEDGTDIRFTLSDGHTPLTFRMLDYSAAAQRGDIWVQIPVLPAYTTTDIYIYYGNAAATAASDGSLVVMVSGGDPVATGNVIVAGALDSRYNGTWAPNGTYNGSPKYTYNSLWLWNDYAESGAQANVWVFGQPGISAHDISSGFAPADDTAYYHAQSQVNAELIANYSASYYPDLNTNWDTYVDSGYLGSGPTTSYEMSDPPPVFLPFRPTVRNGEPITYEPSLTLTIEGVNSGETHNGVTSTLTSQFDEISFGQLQQGAPKFGAQKLTVESNAIFGYTVNVKFDGYMQGLYPANKIDPFGASNVSWTTPQEWSSPDGTELNTDSGWFGANTSDTRVAGWGNAAGLFGPISSVAHTVMSGSDMDSSASAYVSYGMEVNAFQPADMYMGTLIYSIIPEY